MKSNKLGFGKTDLQNTNPNLYPDISEDIQQTISRLLSFDVANQQYKSLITDSDGRLLVSTSALATTTAVNSAASIGVASSSVVAANANRKSIYLYNNGSVTIYLMFGATATLVLGFPLPAGSALFDDKYLGAINAITTIAAQDMRIVEIG